MSTHSNSFNQQQAKVLLEALPYIKKFQGQIVVVKYGGSVLFDSDALRSFCQDVVLLQVVGLRPVVVHGGGKEISHWLQKAGKEAVFIDGLRVTDSETMEITEMVLSGKVRNAIVSQISLAGGRAVGMSGKDSHLFQAVRRIHHTGEDLGLVGEIETVDASLLKILLPAGVIPVISSVGFNKFGETLNINADEAAASVAGALQASKLIYLSNVPGILKDGKLLTRLTTEEARALRKDPAIQGGMIPKLDSSIRALDSGVSRVHIIDGSVEHGVLLEVFTDEGVGTMFVQGGG